MIPLGYLIIRSSENGFTGFIKVISRPRMYEIIFTTLSLSILVGLLSLFLGVTTSWLISRTNVYFRKFWLLLLPIPLSMPSYVLTYGWVTLIPNLQGFWVAVLVLSCASFPFVAIPVYANLKSIDSSQEEVARTLGLNTWGIFVRVIWPQIRTASIAGSLLAGLYALSEFGTVAILKVDTLTRLIFTTYRATYDRSSAATISIILLLVSLLVVTLSRRFSGNNFGSKVGPGISRNALISNIGKLRLLALSFFVLLNTFIIGIPGYVLISRSFQVRQDIELSELLKTAFNTVQVSFIGASLALILAIPLGILGSRFKSNLSTRLESTILITHAVPSIVIALSLVALSVNWLPFIYQTIFLLSIAYSLLFMANSIGIVKSNIAKVSTRLEDVSRTLGKDYYQTLFKVTIPIALPGILSGWLLVFVTAMKELPATLILKPTSFETLSTQLWTATSISQYAQAAPYALLLVVLASVPSYLLNRNKDSVRMEDR
jgi:iron(III) transport system permease protein